MITRKSKGSSDSDLETRILGTRLTFGAAVEGLRVGNETSQAEFARKLGVSRQYLCDVEKGRRLVSPEQAARLKYALDHLKPGLIIVDSFRQGQTLDENSSKDMAAVMGILKTWTQIDRTTVIALHHTNKGGGAKQEWKSSARGSGEIIASAGVVCEVEPGKITWTKTQAWKINGTRTATFEITDSFSDAIADDDLDEDQTKIIRLVQRVNVKATSALPGEAEAESVKQIVDALAKAGREIVMFKDIPALVPNMKADVLKEALRNARQMHQLEYVRTPKGRGYRVAKKR